MRAGTDISGPAPLPDVAQEQRLLRSLIFSAAAELNPNMLLFVADVMASRLAHYESLVCERMVWRQAYLADSSGEAGDTEDARRAVEVDAARELVETTEDCLALLQEFCF